MVNEDLSEAFKWYKLAAGEERTPESHAFAGAMQMLGYEMRIAALRSLHKYYLSGECPEGKPQPAKAFFYLERGAELGDVKSQKDLGLALMKGSCCEKDLAKAERWLEKAAEKGELDSQKVCKFV